MSNQTQIPERVYHIKRDIGGPQHNPQIEEWLSLLCGNQFEKVLDWLALAPDLNKPLCALVFKGVPASGKTLFVQGLASIWADSPTSNIMGAFNEDLARCPIVSIEGALPQEIDEVKQELGKLSHPLHRKYQAPAVLEGALRVIFVLGEREKLTISISTALSSTPGQLFLQVSPSPEASMYLGALTPELKGQWGATEIGRYVLWLAANHQVEQ